MILSESLPPHDTNVQYLKYIPLDKIPDWQALGWQIKSLDSHHSDYSVLGVWLCSCPMVIPR